MLKSLSLRTKLLAGFSCASLLLVAMGGFSYYMLKEVILQYDHIAEINLPNAQMLGEMSKSYLSVRVELRTLAIDGLDEAEIQKIASNVEKHIEEYEKSDKTYRAVPFEPGEDAFYQEVDRSWKAFKAAGVENLRRALSKDPTDRDKFKQFVIKTCPEMARNYHEKMDALESFQATESQKWSKRADVKAEQSTTGIIAVILGGTLLAMSFGYFISRQINLQLSNIARSLSSGATEIANASVNVSSASEQLSSASTEQASSLQQTSASVTELSQMVAKNAENARSASQTSTESQVKANEGKAAVEKMVNAIEDIDRGTSAISNQVEESNREISEIIKVIADIQEKTKVINDIVFQTKLLSFNASVEAARAGEHGKGFAVVAEEVGNLAHMSGNASKEISTLLSESLEKVERTIRDSQSKVSALIENNKEKVRLGTDVAQNCGVVLEELVHTATSVQNLAQEISVASQEQATGIQEIDRAVTQLDQVTQQNSDAAAQTAGSATELSSQAVSLKELVQELLGILNGTGGNVSAPVFEERSSDRNYGRTSSSSASKAAQVLPLRPVAKAKRETPATADSSPSAEQKQVAGDIPSLDDKRFKDI